VSAQTRATDGGAAPGRDELGVGDLVEDVDGGGDGETTFAVVNLPPVPAVEWDAYKDDDGEPVTVAEDNPDYPEGDDVVAVCPVEWIREDYPEWCGAEQIRLAELSTTFYSFPATRLRRVGHLTDLDGVDADDQDDSNPTVEERLTDGQRDLRDRLAERSEVGAVERGGEAVLVVSKLGEEHTIRPDGSVDGGPVADRLESLAADYLGGETA
jgi:hypothetical protein